MTTPVTLNDIAKALGLSKATVSYVLSGRGEERRIAAKTIQRVTEHAEQVGYMPNAIARSLSRQRSGMVGIVCSGFQMNFLHEVCRGLEPVLAKAGITPLFAARGWDSAREHEEIRRLAEHRVDGILVLNPIEASRPLYERLAAGRTQVVLLNDRLDGLEQIDSIVWDAGPAVQAVVGHLASIGRRRVAFAGSIHDAVGTRHRHRDFLDAARQAGLETRDDWIHWQPINAEQAVQHPVLRDEWLASLPWGTRKAPDAVFCLNDNVAYSVMAILLHLGMRIPEDVAVTGLGDLPSPVADLPGLTTAVEPLKTLGARGAERLLARIEDPKLPSIHESVDKTRLIVRRSTVPTAAPGWA